MNVLVFNCGSSSLKYRLISMPEERELAGGEAQRVGTKTAERGRIYHHFGGAREEIPADMPDHGAAFGRVMEILRREPSLAPDCIGHRVVHGGDVFSAPTRIDDKAIERMEPLNRLAPIHNPPALNLIRAIRTTSPSLAQVAVFDTAFHMSIPYYAYTYALPRMLREEHGIRKYGFHGTSHRFVMEQAAKFLGRPLARFRAVSCHLGSGGASLCAIANGRSRDNTMGYSPLPGLVMST
ncbi:MAG: acetate kinase, partial [Planctomycetota bacterium]|nr:acetate kinase [Planctomycetota bacterium]